MRQSVPLVKKEFQKIIMLLTTLNSTSPMPYSIIQISSLYSKRQGKLRVDLHQPNFVKYISTSSLCRKFFPQKYKKPMLVFDLVDGTNEDVNFLKITLQVNE